MRTPRTLAVSVAAVAVAAALLGPGARRASAQEVAPVPSGASARGEGLHLDVAPVSTVALASGQRIVLGAYKNGESWPLRNANGLDFLEPWVPLAAASRHDWGRIALESALPYSMFAAAFAFESTDKKTLIEIGRWHWAGLDEKQDNYPVLYGLTGLAALSLFLPAPEDGDGYSWDLRIDRATVFAIGMGLATIEPDLIKPIFHRQRPNHRGFTSRPSGHSSAAFAAMAFFSDVLRDTIRPQEETSFQMRIVEELACAVPYLGAGYVALERVHGKKHYLTDTLLGGAIGAFTMHMVYAWSFTRTEQGRAWVDDAWFGYNPEQKGLEVGLVWKY